MTEKKCFFRDSGRFWYGYRRGIPALCVLLDAPDTLLFKNRPKIKAGAVNGFFVKRYNLQGFFNQLRSYLKTPRPFKVMQGAEKLRRSGIATPEIHGALIGWKRLCRRDYLVTDLLGGENQFLDKMLLAGKENEVWQILLDKFIPALEKLHSLGAVHGDLSMRNLYLSENGTPGMIDLDGMRFFNGAVPRQEREAELGRLISSFHLITLYISGKKDTDTAVPEEKIVQAASRCSDRLDTENIRREMEKLLRRGKKYL